MTMATTTTQDQIREAVETAFPFEVVKMPLFFPDNQRTPVYGLQKDSNGTFVGSSSVTARYVPHTTEDVIALAEAGSSLFEGEAQVKCCWRDGHYVTVEPTKEYRHDVFGTGDAVFPRLVISAGYDATSFGASIGYWRDACRNLAMLQRVKGTTIRIRHTSGLRDQIDQLITRFQLLSGGWEAMTEQMDQMEQRRIAVADFMRELYGEGPEKDGKSKTMFDNRIEAIMTRVMRERQELGKRMLRSNEGRTLATAWELFNGVQGYEQHDAIRRQKGGVSNMDRIILAAGKADVAKAEKLAMELPTAVAV